MQSPVIRHRSLSDCGSALRCPLFVFLIDVFCVASHLLLWDVFDYILPVRAPCCLLGLKTPSSDFSWFLSLNHWHLPPSVFSSGQSVSSLPASGRCIAGICFLSHSARTLPSDLGLSLSCVTSYSHKSHSPMFPVTPIRHMTSGVPRVHLLSPIRAYIFLISQSLIRIEDVPLSLRRLRLWVRHWTLLPASMGSVSGCF